VGDAPPPPPMPPSPAHDLSESVVANSFSSSETTPSASHVPAFFAAPDTRVPFSIKKNRFGLRP
jgi:hypothetical protein